MARFGELQIIILIRKNGLRFLIATIPALVFIALVLLIEYFIHFHNGFSNNSEDWSNFGQFISGVFSIVLSFINLLILIYIAYTASKGDQHRWETDLRIANFKDLLKEIGKVNAQTTSGVDISNLKEFLEVTDLNNYYYLEGKEEIALQTIQEKLIKTLDDLFNSIIDSSLDIEKNGKKEFEENKSDFIEMKKDLIKMLGCKIMKREKDVKIIVDKYQPINQIKQLTK